MSQRPSLPSRSAHGCAIRTGPAPNCISRRQFLPSRSAHGCAMRTGPTPNARPADARCGRGRRQMACSTPLPAKLLGPRMRDADRAGRSIRISRRPSLPSNCSARESMRDQAAASAGAAMLLNAQLPEAQVPTVAPSPSNATDGARPTLAAAKTRQAETEARLEQTPSASRTRVPGRR